MISTTTLLITATAVVSAAAFESGSIMPESLQRPEWTAKFRFNAYLVWHGRQYYRMLSHGLVHADYRHLLFNMLTLYFFGDFVEARLQGALGIGAGKAAYTALYVTALAASSSVDLFRHRDNPGYNAIGASGAVSAVLFAAIYFDPTIRISLMFIPIPMPGWLFGILYLAYCAFMDKRAMDNIGHAAHLAGAVYGYIFPLIITKAIL